MKDLVVILPGLSLMGRLDLLHVGCIGGTLAGWVRLLVLLNGLCWILFYGM